jgi:HPt (histidine-containing phosphotransfer) domain-containing protein
VKVIDPALILDREQLREITLDDDELMREILEALIDDTSRQIQLLESAIREEDAQKCMRLAHYSKGACANVGANAAAHLCKQIEVDARNGGFLECGNSLAALSRELDLLRAEAGH